jgi:hypothetical protein
VAAQLVASRVVLSSTELVSQLFFMDFVLTDNLSTLSSVFSYYFVYYLSIIVHGDWEWLNK